MFTAYVDDSGTDPSQKVAIATALIVPTARVDALEREWEIFADRWGIHDFHASECAASNSKSEFAGWNQPKVRAAFRAVRKIAKKYGVKGFSLAVRKSDYDELLPAELLQAFGRHHYTYAVHNILGFVDAWACQAEIEQPVEYVFDWIDPKSAKLARLEVEEAFSRAEAERPGRFANHYSFQRREDRAGLRCADLLGWTCYRYSLSVHEKLPMTDLQAECWRDFDSYRNKQEWLIAIGQTRDQIEEAVRVQMQQFGLKAAPVRPHVNPSRLPL